MRLILQPDGIAGPPLELIHAWRRAYGLLVMDW